MIMILVKGLRVCLEKIRERDGGLGDCTVCVGAKTHMTMERRY